MLRKEGGEHYAQVFVGTQRGCISASCEMPKKGLFRGSYPHFSLGDSGRIELIETSTLLNAGRIEADWHRTQALRSIRSALARELS